MSTTEQIEAAEKEWHELIALSAEAMAIRHIEAIEQNLFNRGIYAVESSKIIRICAYKKSLMEKRLSDAIDAVVGYPYWDEVTYQKSRGFHPKEKREP